MYFLILIPLAELLLITLLISISIMSYRTGNEKTKHAVRIMVGILLVVGILISLITLNPLGMVAVACISFFCFRLSQKENYRLSRIEKGKRNELGDEGVSRR